MTRFRATDAYEGTWPLIIALEGPPGGGKTFSALRLAAGMARVTGGVPYVIDTEKGRSAKYQDKFKFKHVAFDPPFRSPAFLEAIQYCVEDKAGAVIVDSMSDEHEGMLEWHDELGNHDSYFKRTKQARNKLCAGILQITTPIIMTFRAREKTKVVEERGKTKAIPLGFTPIAASELVHCCDMVCLLPSRSDGVPVWRSDTAGEDFMLKLPLYLQPFIKEGQLDEPTGEALAKWSRRVTGVAVATITDDELSVLIETGHSRSEAGMEALGIWWSSLSSAEKHAIGKEQLDAWKKSAEEHDAHR